MLTAYALKNPAQAATYYDRDNYYASDVSDRGPSSWWGAGAALLGLTGAVERAQFEALLDGRINSTTLLGTLRDGEWQHKPGFDLTWSAPKSVSIMSLVTGDARLIDAHDRAVETAMRHVEGQLAYTRRRDGDSVTLVRTNNIAAALFRHDLNREQEPQLHTHAVVLNATQTADGVWRSLESRPIFQAIKDTGAIYRSALAAEVMRLGYEIQLKTDGTWDLKGVPEAVIQEHSTRSQQIEAKLAERGLTRETATTGEKMTANRLTRKEKTPADRSELQQVWRERLAADMPTLDKVRAAAIDNTPTAAVVERETRDAALLAVRAAISTLSDREASFSHDRLARTAMQYAFGKADPTAIHLAITSLVTATELLPRQVTEPSPTTRRDEQLAGYTTPQAVGTEQRLLHYLEEGRGGRSPLVRDYVAENAIAAGEKRSAELGLAWNDGQRAAARTLLTSRDSVTLLQGYAGTSKTSTVLATVAAAARASGYEVRAIAPTASAARQLGQSIASKGQTVHSHLNDASRRQQGRTLVDRVAAMVMPRKELWIVDEGSLLGTGKAVELLIAARQENARVILTGDRLQLGAVEAGKAFIQAQAKLPVSELTDIVRQKTEPSLRAVRSAINRDASAALAAIGADRTGMVQEQRDRTERIMQIARHYTALAADLRLNTIIIDPSREGNEAITEAVRTLLRIQGDLTGPAVTATRLVDAKLSEADKRFAQSYEAGFVLRAGAPIAGLDGTLQRGEHATVTGMDHARNTVGLRTDGGQDLTLAAEAIGRGTLDVYRAQTGTLLAGDRIRWGKNDKTRDLDRGDLGTVTAVSGDRVTVALDKGPTLALDLTRREDQRFDYGYSLTGYGAQGLTRNWILHAESWRVNLVNWRSFYVGISRGETAGTLYTDDRSKLVVAIETRAGEKTAALDGASFGKTVEDAARSAMMDQTANRITADPVAPVPDRAQRSAQSWLAQVRDKTQERTPGPHRHPDRDMGPFM